MKAEVSGYTPQQFSRRDLLKAAAGLVFLGSGVLSGCEADEETQKREALTKNIEGRHLVKFVSKGDLYLGGTDTPSSHRLAWKSSQLEMVEGFLERTPPHMTVPHDSTQRIRYVNGEFESNSIHGECCSVSLAGGQLVLKDALTFNHKIFIPENKESFDIYLHENGHRITPWRIKQFGMKKDSEIDYEEATWMHGLGNVLGGDSLMDFNEVLKRKREGASRVKRSANGFEAFIYSLRNVDEFIAGLSEFYGKGEKQFMKMYLPHFGEDKARDLYSFAKEFIFRGYEYS